MSWKLLGKKWKINKFVKVILGVVRRRIDINVNVVRDVDNRSGESRENEME